MSRGGSNYRMYGTDRGQYAARSATTTFSVSAPTVGVIGDGTVVELTIDGDAPAPADSTTSVEVRAKATGAVPLSVVWTGTAKHTQWSIAGTTLTFSTTGGALGAGNKVTMEFWVF